MHPAYLVAFIGSFGGPSFRLELEHDLLYYERRGARYVIEESESISPSGSEWVRFLAALEAAGAFTWDGHYTPARAAVHERHWHLELRAGSRMLNASGEGAAPDGFEQVLSALSALAGGRTFR